MSETEREKKTASVIGVLDGITEKPTGWTHIEVIPDGASRPMVLATKLQPLIEMARSAGTERMLWTYKEQDGKNINPHTNEPYKDRYFEKVAPLGDEPTTGNGSSPVRTPAPADAMTKADWAAKDSAIHKMACVKVAAAALTHTVPSDPTDADLTRFLERVLFLVGPLHRSVLAERDDPAGEDIPFD